MVRQIILGAMLAAVSFGASAQEAGQPQGAPSRGPSPDMLQSGLDAAIVQRDNAANEALQSMARLGVASRRIEALTKEVEASKKSLSEATAAHHREVTELTRKLVEAEGRAKAQSAPVDQAK